jgi:hypothetical protein
MTSACRCKVCMEEKGRSRSYPNRAAVIRHRRKAHPNAPKARNWSKEARERRENGGKLPTVARKKKEQPITCQLRWCTHCGARRGAEWRYCGVCGTRLERRR